MSGTSLTIWLVTGLLIIFGVVMPTIYRTANTISSSITIPVTK
jgi:hypothetical protein